MPSCVRNSASVVTSSMPHGPCYLHPLRSILLPPSRAYLSPPSPAAPHTPTGIKLRDTVAACAAGYLASTPLLDMNYEEDSAGGPDVAVAYQPGLDKIVLLQVRACVCVSARVLVCLCACEWGMCVGGASVCW
jgi:hypothetical protein